MRRTSISAVAIGAAVIVLIGATMARSRVNGADAATIAAVPSTSAPLAVGSIVPPPTPVIAPVYLALDCDVVVPGIQDNCTLPPGAPSADVGVVLVNNTGSAIQLGAFDFLVEDPDPGRLNPPTVGGPIADRNPDLNQAELSNAIVCELPEADTHHGAPGAAESHLGCYDSAFPAPSLPPVPIGGQLKLATVHYLVPLAAAPGAVTLSLAAVGLADFDTQIIGECDFGCPEATITIVSAPVNPPTATASPSPTATPTPGATPVVISAPPSSTPTADIYFAVDCDLTQPGVQSDCTYRLGDATEIDVGFVLVNNGPQPPFPLAAFQFMLHMPDRGRLAPLPSLSILDGNPDFNDAGIPGDWACPQARSDIGTDGPAAAVSFLGCFEPGAGGNGPRLATGSELLLGTVRYSVAASAQPGSVSLRADSVESADVHAVLLAACDELATDPPRLCLPATLNLIAYPAITKVPAGIGANVNQSIHAANLWDLPDRPVRRTR